MSEPFWADNRTINDPDNWWQNQVFKYLWKPGQWPWQSRDNEQVIPESNLAPDELAYLEEATTTSELESRLGEMVYAGRLTKDQADNVARKILGGMYGRALQQRTLKQQEPGMSGLITDLERQQQVDQQNQLWGKAAQEQAANALIAGTQRQPSWQSQWQAPQAPTYQEPFEEWMKTVPGIPNIQNYLRGSAGNILGQFQKEQPGVREQWWSNLNPNLNLAPESPAAHQQRLESERDRWGTIASVAPDQNITDIANQAQQTAAGYLAGGAGTEAPGGLSGQTQSYLSAKEQGDPWLNYLKKYPWMQEWKMKAPEERGYYAQKFAPRTSWGKL